MWPLPKRWLSLFFCSFFLTAMRDKGGSLLTGVETCGEFYGGTRNEVVAPLVFSRFLFSSVRFNLRVTLCDIAGAIVVALCLYFSLSRSLSLRHNEG